MTARNVFLRLLDTHVSDGTLLVRWPGGEQSVGWQDGGRPPIEVAIAVHDEAFFARVLSGGNMGLGEAFMDGAFEVEGDRLPDLLTLLLRNQLRERIRGDARLMWAVAGVYLQNALAGARRNVQRHYDLGDDLFETFLDETLTYSCGYARGEDDTLAQLQQQKLARICAKLRLAPGQRLLDIGCGWGGLLRHAERHHGVEGLGITLSQRQFAYAQAAAAKEGRVAFALQDMTSVEGRFDRVVSVGMLEHVRRADYGTYFDRIRQVLAPGGLALVHAIGCGVETNEHDPFTQRYIFPGSALPKLSELADALERRRMPILDVENLQRHYGVTCQRWLEGFMANRGRLDPTRYDARFQRMWQYYLSAGIAAARAGEVAVYQVLFTNDFAGERSWARV